MFPDYRKMCNAQALKNLCKAPTLPAENLGVGEDEYHADVPLVIFANQHLPAQRPLVVNPNTLPYEKTAANGAGDRLTMDDFTTNDFQIGEPFGSV